MQDPQTQPEKPAESPESGETADAIESLNFSEPMDWLPEPLQPAWAVIADYPLVAAAVIVLVGFLLARLVVFVFKRVTSHLTSRTRTDIDDQVIQLLGRPIFATVFYASLIVATASLDLSPAYTSAINRIIITLGVLVWTGAAFPISNLVLKTLAHLSDRYELIEDRTLPLFDILSKVLIAGLAAYALLMIWNIDATAWLASAGVVGIAVGFAARDTLANLFSGVFIVADAPYKIGDFVNLDSGERGMVTHVGLRSTRLLTRDDIEITIPNAVIGNAKIVNETGGRWEKRRVRIPVGVAYGSDVDQVCEELLAVANDHPKICGEPTARVRMRGFGASSLDFELLGWIDQPVDRGKVTHELLMAVYKQFESAGIEIPYAKHDLYIKEMPETGRVSD